MSLRCRAGEKAIILRGPYIGYTVSLVDFLGNINTSDISGRPVAMRDAWEVSCPQIFDGSGEFTMGIEDKDLHPIAPERRRKH